MSGNVRLKAQIDVIRDGIHQVIPGFEHRRSSLRSKEAVETTKNCSETTLTKLGRAMYIKLKKPATKSGSYSS